MSKKAQRHASRMWAHGQPNRFPVLVHLLPSPEVPGSSSLSFFCLEKEREVSVREVYQETEGAF